MDSVRIIYSQKLFFNLNNPSQEQIDNYLYSLGFHKNGYYYENDYIAITDVSAQSDNVLIDDSNNLIFIDPIIKLTRPAKEVLSYLSTNSINNLTQHEKKNTAFFRRVLDLFRK